MRIITQHILKLIVFLLFINSATSVCYDVMTGDTLPIFSNQSYCQSIINWPISDQIIATNATADARALANYQGLYALYQSGAVGVNCLGVGMYFFCADAYPTCTSSNHSIPGVCSWLCNLVSVRCGTDNSYYKSICSNQNTAGDCAWESKLMSSLLLLALLFLS